LASGGGCEICFFKVYVTTTNTAAAGAAAFNFVYLIHMDYAVYYCI